jgi:hypothetical protein
VSPDNAPSSESEPEDDDPKSELEPPPPPIPYPASKVVDVVVPAEESPPEQAAKTARAVTMNSRFMIPHW